MKYIFTFLLSLLSLISINAQDEAINPVKWQYEMHKEKDTIILSFIAEIDQNWSVYSQHISGDGPIATSIHFDSENINRLSEYAEEVGSKKLEGYDALFDLNLTKYKERLKLVQKLTINSSIETITGYLEFMTCTEELCMFPEPYKFTINLKK